MILRAVLLVALAAAAAFAVWETRRWRMPHWRGLISARQRRLRAWGLFFLFATLGLWLGGTFLPAAPRRTQTQVERQAALHYLGYWMLTVLCAVPLLPLALLDSRENLRRYLQERQSLTEQRTAMVHDYLERDLDDAPDASSSSKPAP
jgi:hypothetical protein